MAATTYFNKFPSYCRMVAHAKSLANRSVLVDHCGLDHIDLLTELKNVEHVYSIEKETRRGLSKLSLIEFKSDKDADQVTEQAHHNEGLLPVPLKILRYNARMNVSQPPAQSNYPFQIDHVRLGLDKESSPSFKSYTELMSNNMMSLVGLKLRFVTLVNFERILCSGMFEKYELMPFGSSVIDTGCDSGDLDLIFTRKVDHYNAIISNNQSVIHQERRDQNEHSQLVSPLSSPSSALSSRLVHLDKSLYSETKDNSGFRGTMRWFDHMLREYMPLTDGFGVLTLHRAKVPIIKFTSRITNIDCDLSFDLGLDQRDYDIHSIPVHHGILMTEILYSLCRNNNLITALVIYLRIFAKVNAITSKVPGVGMTNFQFLSTVIFFLQQTTVQRLPTYASHDQKANDESLTSNLDSLGGRFTVRYVQPREQVALIPPFKDLVDGDFLLKQRQPILYNDDELNEILPPLIKRYFDFYSTFDFARHSLNLYESKRDKKLDNSTLFVLNPIDKTRNICHNVNRKGLETLVNQVRSASATIRASRGACPLSLLKSMMIKHQKQTKKNRSLGIQIDDINDAQTFNPQGIFQDACR